MVMKRGRGRPPVYAKAIEAVKVGDGWVNLSEQANRTAPSGYRSRYPAHDFRVVPNAKRNAKKPYVLQVRRMRKAEREAGGKAYQERVQRGPGDYEFGVEGGGTAAKPKFKSYDDVTAYYAGETEA